MEKGLSLKGLVVPLPTPFDDDNEIDYGALLSHMDWLSECGVRNILINGTTAEFFSLTHNEQMKLLRVSRANWKGSLVFHVGCSALPAVLESAHIAEHEGADFIAALPPYYFANAPVEGVVEWFSQLALTMDLPLILYNFPKHTGNALTPEMMKQIPHWGMKDSSGDLSLLPSTPNYYIGGDRKISAAYAAGAKGFVSAASNIEPLTYLRIAREQTPDNQAAVDAANALANGPYAIAKVKQRLADILPGYPSRLRPPLGFPS